MGTLPFSGRGRSFLCTLFLSPILTVLVAIPLALGSLNTWSGPENNHNYRMPAGCGYNKASPGGGVLDLPGGSRPYYAPEAAHISTAEEGETLERIAQSVPADLLPQSLLPEGGNTSESSQGGSAPGVTEGESVPGAAGEDNASEEPAGGTPEAADHNDAAGTLTEDFASETYRGGSPTAPEGDLGGDFTAAGAGGWTPLTRPYLPSANPAITYNSPYAQELDSSGRMHAIYGKNTFTDISQPPDVAGFSQVYLQELLYCTFTEGAWDTPRSISEIAGLGDSDLIYLGVDDGGCAHIVYSAWVWGRDSALPAGVLGAYQHEQENLWYRYVSPQGFMTAPRRLTDFTGSWSILGADFAFQNGRLYGTFTARRNNETTPSSYRAYVGFVEGYLDSWQPAVQLSAWDYTSDPGQRQPDLWPSIDVSGLGGEVAVAYAVRTVPVALYTGKTDVYGCVRRADGTWDSTRNISNAADNEMWLPLTAFYKRGTNTAAVLAMRLTIIVDDTHPPRDDILLIYHAGGAWQAPVNVTRVAAQQRGGFADIEMDTFNDLHFCYTVTRHAWVGGNWQNQGQELKYTRETGAGMSAPATILPYLLQRYFADARLALDSDDDAHVLFSSCMFDGANYWNYNVGYSTNSPGGDPGGFDPPAVIRPNTAITIYSLNLSAFPDGDVLASWFEKAFDGGGNPVYGRMYSRYRDGDAWGDTVMVSSIPGSTDILHVTQFTWPHYEDVMWSGTGEQQVVFETAKYDAGTATWYDFRKYFTETVNGVWTTPQLVSSANLSGETPMLFSDGGQRYFVLYGSRDAATGKEVLYATQQREPTPPASTYFFAEGTTREGFDEWLCIQNPGDAQADVTITYMLDTGANIDQAVPVPAHARTTVNVNAIVGAGRDVSARVEADRLIVAERPMYFDYNGWTGGHCVMGARDTSRLWYFAEGTTREGFHEYLTLQNPSGEDARVDITYVLGGGTTMPGSLVIGPRSRATVNVNTAVGAGQDVSLVVESDTAIVAERPMYFDYRGMTGGHCEVGSNSLANRWYFAEGTTRSGFDTYICLQNPYEVDTTAALTFILGDGSTLVQPMLVPATSRQTLRVNDAVGPGRDVSTVVESDGLLLAERPMYFLYGGSWAGGHVAAGVRAPKNAWFFAEGTTRGGFVEWLSLQNPGDVDAAATISLMLEDGTVHEAGVAVPAHTRVTVAVPNLVDPEHDVSVVVECDRAIVAERPMYFLYQNKWPGGHVVPGL